MHILAPSPLFPQKQEWPFQLTAQNPPNGSRYTLNKIQTPSSDFQRHPKSAYLFLSPHHDDPANVAFFLFLNLTKHTACIFVSLSGSLHHCSLPFFRFNMKCHLFREAFPDSQIWSHLKSPSSITTRLCALNSISRCYFVCLFYNKSSTRAGTILLASKQ